MLSQFGLYYLTQVVLDAGNEIIETDETNNDLAWNVSVSGCQGRSYMVLKIHVPLDCNHSGISFSLGCKVYICYVKVEILC